MNINIGILAKEKIMKTKVIVIRSIWFVIWAGSLLGLSYLTNTLLYVPPIGLFIYYVLIPINIAAIVFSLVKTTLLTIFCWKTDVTNKSYNEIKKSMPKSLKCIMYTVLH